MGCPWSLPDLQNNGAYYVNPNLPGTVALRAVYSNQCSTATLLLANPTTTYTCGTVTAGAGTQTIGCPTLQRSDFAAISQVYTAILTSTAANSEKYTFTIRPTQDTTTITVSTSTTDVASTSREITRLFKSTTTTTTSSTSLAPATVTIVTDTTTTTTTPTTSEATVTKTARHATVYRTIYVKSTVTMRKCPSPTVARFVRERGMPNLAALAGRSAMPLLVPDGPGTTTIDSFSSTTTTSVTVTSTRTTSTTREIDVATTTTITPAATTSTSTSVSTETDATTDHVTTTFTYTKTVLVTKTRGTTCVTA